MNKCGIAHYIHNAAAMSTIGNVPNAALDFEMYKTKIYEEEKDEGEFASALRLLNRVVKEHQRFIDIVVYDVLACSSVFIKDSLNLRLMLQYE